MKYELVRLGTFQEWPSWGRVRPVKLAPEGFFYTGQRDVVACFSCKTEVGQWEFGQDASERHRSLAPSCAVVLGHSDNVPMSLISTNSYAEEDDGFQDSHDATVEQGAESTTNTGLDQLYEFMPKIRDFEASMSGDSAYGSMTLGERLASFNLDPAPPVTMPSVTTSSAPAGPSAAAVREASRRTFTSSGTNPPTESLSSLSSNPNIDSSQIKLESYRLSTFDNGWPESAFVGPPELAKNGFYYLGSLDRVKCAFCSGILRNWRPDDRPDQEHRRHFSHCPFVRGLDVGNVTIEDEMRGVQLPGNRVGCHSYSHPWSLKPLYCWILSMSYLHVHIPLVLIVSP